MSNQSEEKIVYLLVGAKGSGKTHIGQLLERELNIEFLHVEKLLIDYAVSSELKSELLTQDGYDLEERWIDKALQRRDEVISEATGSSIFLTEFICQLRKKYRVMLVRVKCPLTTCFKRVKRRSSTDQFLVSDDKVRSINRMSHRVQLDWDFEIDNAGLATDAEIVTIFASQRGKALA